MARRLRPLPDLDGAAGCGELVPGNDFDAVVNANVLAYLGDRPEKRWVEALIMRDAASDALVHYAGPAGPVRRRGAGERAQGRVLDHHADVAAQGGAVKVAEVEPVVVHGA